MEKATEQFITPLESFRKDVIMNVKVFWSDFLVTRVYNYNGMCFFLLKAEKKKFDKESSKFYHSQEKYLAYSLKKDEAAVKEVGIWYMR